MNADQKRAFLAVLLSGAVLLIWQMFLIPKEQPRPATEHVQVSKSTDIETKREKVTDDSNVSVSTEYKEYDLSFNKFFLKLSSRFELLDFASESNVYQFSDLYKKIPFQIYGERIDADNFLHISSVEKLTDESFQLNFSSGPIEKCLIFERDNKLEFVFSFTKPTALSFLFKHTETTLENGQISQFVYFDQSMETISISDEENKELPVSWFGIDFNYHLLAISLPKKESYRYIVNNSEFKLFKTNVSNEYSFDLVFTKKNYDFLIGLGNNLDKSIDFGIFGILAVPILRGLQFAYDYIPNYGVGIILLTLLIRLLTFPLQYKSFVGMKKMQTIQPELMKLREKFKDDPQRMQKETMDLFKRSGANPLGGCLPLLLQMPVFFAFYKVLYAAVELVDAPFALWIHDLSAKDPYFVLPVAMTIMMFLQQKLSPSGTMDPTQQKVMLFMPIVFGFIMKDLPSGLVLYILVSTLFGIIQQLYVYKTAKV